jgi:PPIC-type PPIASE domain
MLGSAVQLPDPSILEDFCMRKSWLLCVLLGTLAWGQSEPPAAQAPSGPVPAPGAAAKAPLSAPEVPENAIVLTIKGVCSPTARTAAAAKTAGSKTPSAAAKKPADCKTEITRAQFEKIANALSPNLTPQLKRQLETVLPRFMAMSQAAKAKGLDKTPRFEELMKVVRMQVLTQELQRSVQEQADKVSAEDIEGYYKENQQAYEQYSLDRLFIPRFKQAEPEKEEAKDLTDDQRKAKQAADKAKQDQGEQELNKLADSLRARAAAGEDFAKLQKEAFEASGEKVDNPTVNLPKVRRSGLPPAHAAVFDLKVGEVSTVISDNGGHYVYKVLSEEAVPLDQVKDEIHNKLKAERMKTMMDKYTNSFESVPNEAYFGPPAAPGGGMRGGPPPRMMRPQMAPPPTQPQSQTPAGAPPAANPPSPPPPQAPPSNPN